MPSLLDFPPLVQFQPASTATDDRVAALSAFAAFQRRRDMPVASNLHGAACCLLARDYTDAAIERALDSIARHGSAQCLDVAGILDDQADVDAVEATLESSPEWGAKCWTESRWTTEPAGVPAA